MARDCYFCGATPVSREDVFRRDFSKYVIEWPTTDRVTFHGRSARVREFNTRPIHGVVSKTVCAGCNNGWMNELDARVERVLEPLFRGRSSAVEVSDLGLIRAYVVKTASIRLLVDNADPLTTRAEKDGLRKRQEVASDWSVWLAKSDTPGGFFHASTTYGVGTTVMHQVTWCIGQLICIAFRVTGAPQSAAALNRHRARLTTLLTDEGPSFVRVAQRRFEWPPIQHVEAARIPLVAQTLDRYVDGTLLYPTPVVMRLAGGRSFEDEGVALDTLIGKMRATVRPGSTWEPLIRD